MVKYTLMDIKHLLDSLNFRWAGVCKDFTTGERRKAKLSEFADHSVTLYVTDKIDNRKCEISVAVTHRSFSIHDHSTGKMLLCSETWRELLKSKHTELNF